MFTLPTTMSNKGAIAIVAATWEAIATNTNGSGDSTVNITTPGGLVAGDLMLLYWLGDGGTAAEIQSPYPTGWALLYNQSPTLGGSASYVQIAYKYHTGSEPASYTFDLLGGTDDGIAIFHAWRGVSSVLPVDGANGQNTIGATTHTTLNVTTTYEDTQILYCYFFNGQGQGALSVSSYPPNTSTIGILDGSPALRDDLLMVIQRESTTGAPQTYTGKSITLNNSADGHSLIMGIRAANT